MHCSRHSHMYEGGGGGEQQNKKESTVWNNATCVCAQNSMDYNLNDRANDSVSPFKRNGSLKYLYIVDYYVTNK